MRVSVLLSHETAELLDALAEELYDGGRSLLAVVLGAPTDDDYHSKIELLFNPGLEEDGRAEVVRALREGPQTQT